PEPTNMSLANLAGGAAVERFDAALAEVLANIYDENAPYKPPRRVNLVVTVHADETRRHLKVSIACKPVLAALHVIETGAELGFDEGALVAREPLPARSMFNPDGTPAKGVLPFKEGETNGA
ncbi:MAG TPA: hypothetical protein PK435_16535, partial [Thermoanaerobaculaceae bacterium]|nr:hypothetical protein [Thermoanaerobaculaceae bacterium]